MRTRRRVAHPGTLYGLLLLVAACGPDTPPDGSYEYIVVGSGAGGGPVAARLARSGHRVLLLEAGEDVSASLDYQVPARHALSTEDPAMAWWFFVQHHADLAIDQADSKWTPQGILYPRGSALGGSTAVNAMVTVLPSPSDWDRLALQTRDPALRAVAMDPYYDRVREWLSIEIPAPSLALDDTRVTSFLLAAANTYAQEQGGGTVLDAASLSGLLQADVNQRLRGGEVTGMFRLPLATRGGRRGGTRELIQATVDAGFPLVVLTGAFVTRVLWDPGASPPSARGVEYVRRGAVYGASLVPAIAPVERHQALADREVILSAGVFNTPQLLLLSGVGDAAALARMGVQPILDRKGVGRNLQDRYEAPVVTEFDGPLDLISRCHLGEPAAADPCLRDWQQGGGVYTTPGFLASVLMRSSVDQPLADLQIFATPSDARGYFPGYSKAALARKDRFSWLLLKAHTKNRDGLVELVDQSPFSRPRISFHSYDEQAPMQDPDLLALVQGVKFVRRTLLAIPAGAPREIWPGPAVATDPQLAAWIYKESWGHHACCTAKMGVPEDNTAVVDSHFRVLGARRLRVVDASVFPDIPGTFIALPTYLLAERAAAAILEDQAR